ncbi:MAG TPA: hypothetical protein VL443_24255 [Cyclobacteriaceae bacterium]|nr:hypothetical protein [Cyclobacteriaceae bacterium]
MIKFTPINHQFSLFNFNDTKPKTKIPIKRISKERYEQAVKELKEGKEKSMLNMLRDLNDSLDRYEKRHGI